MGGRNSKDIWEERESPFEEFTNGEDEMDVGGMEVGGGVANLLGHLKDKLKSKRVDMDLNKLEKIVAGTPISGAEAMCKAVCGTDGDEVLKALKTNSQGKGSTVMN